MRNTDYQASWAPFRTPLVSRAALILAATSGLLVGLAGCHHSPPQVAPPAPIKVSVSQPVEKEITDFADFTGRAAAVDSVEMRARVSGYLEKVNFKEGAIVKAGDVLFEIDPRPYQAHVDNVKGQIASNEAAVKKARADNARNLALAAKGTGVVTQADVDQTQAAQDQAIANGKALDAQLKTNELNLEFTKVTAPIAGRVGRALVTIGNLVQPGEQAGGTLLTTIVSVDPMYFYFDVDEGTVLRVRKMIREGKAQSARDAKMVIHLGLANETGFPHEGVVDFVDNQLNPRTGTIRLRGSFPNDKEYLVPGLFGRVRVPIGFKRKALLVSDRALDTDQGQKILYVVNEKDEIDVRPVRVGQAHDGLRVIEEGLKPEDRVVVVGLQQIRPGMKVVPEDVKMPVSVTQGSAGPTGNTVITQPVKP